MRIDSVRTQAVTIAKARVGDSEHIARGANGDGNTTSSVVEDVRTMEGIRWQKLLRELRLAGLLTNRAHRLPHPTETWMDHQRSAITFQRFALLTEASIAVP